MQRKLDDTKDVFEEETGDEETPKGGQEENEIAEGKALGGVVAVSLAELIAERDQVQALLDLAKQVDAKGDESKFDKLREVLDDPESRDEKLIIFTEHRDTLDYLVRRLEGLGFTGQIARIHGGMDFREREAADRVLPQEDHRGRRPSTWSAPTRPAKGSTCSSPGGCSTGTSPGTRPGWNSGWAGSTATSRCTTRSHHQPRRRQDPRGAGDEDAAGQARTHPQGTRPRQGLRRDRSAVRGRQHQGVHGEGGRRPRGPTQACRALEGTLTKEQVEALEAKERRLYGDGGDVKAYLATEREKLDRESWRRLLPGYVRRFVEKSAPLLGLGIDGDLDGTFASHAAAGPARSTSSGTFWRPTRQPRRQRLTVHKPKDAAEVLFLHPGEPVFDRLRIHVCERFADAARRGGGLRGPDWRRARTCSTSRPSRSRAGRTPRFPSLARTEILEHRLVGLRQHEDGVGRAVPGRASAAL